MMLRAVADRAAAADPGLLRLVLAARGTLSVFLMTLGSMLVARLGHWPVVAFASGITLSMMGPFLMREPTLRQRARTLLMLVLPAAAATVATAILHGQGWVGDGSFLVLVFVCFLLNPLSPRAIGLGLIAVIITYVGLYLELPPATLPIQLMSLVVAVPVTAFVSFVLIPLRPAATLRRMVAAVQGRAAQVLHSARAVTDGDPAQANGTTTLRRDLARLNEAALAADDQLALLQPESAASVRTGLIEVELATARLIAAVRSEQPGPRSATRLLLHERRIRRGGAYALEASHTEPGTLLGTLVELGHAVHALGARAQTVEPARKPSPAPTAPPGPLAWRLATRVTLAAGLAMAGGIALSPQRWFWAVMTVYVVFLNARSRGDTVLKGAQRLGGTLLGIASGLVLATVLAGDVMLEIAALLLSIFGMFYLFLISYTAGIFCATVMLGLLYGMLGASMEQLLLLRLEETAIGAAAAMLVAVFVLPARTRDQVMRSGKGVLAALLEVVGASRCALAGLSGPSPIEAMRRVDKRVADLRLALAPLTAGRLLLRRSALERPIPALLDCVHWTRVLAAASHGRVLPQDDAAGLLRELGAIEGRLARLAGVAATEAGGCGVAGTGPAADPAELREALDGLGAAVALLAERLELGTLEGFAVEA